MSPISSTRVVARYLSAKGSGVSLIPDFNKAKEKMADGDSEAMLVFMSRLEGIIMKDSSAYADWFYALGTAKRNSIDWLRTEILVFKSRQKKTPDPAALASQLEWNKTQWLKSLRTVEIASVGGDADQEFAHGPYTIVPMPGLSKAVVNAAIEALDQATDKIRPKFPEVLYGKVFLTGSLGKATAAKYLYNEDKFYLNVFAKKRFSDMYTIIHELGHRHENKFLSIPAHKKFWDLSVRKVFKVLDFDSKLREQMADEVVAIGNAKLKGQAIPPMSSELIAWLKSNEGPKHAKELMTSYLAGMVTEKDLHDGVKGSKDVKVITDDLLHGPLSVTPYGATKPMENYAEAFAHYVLGMDMPQELADILATEK